MKEWNFDLYAIKNETKDDIEYWNFFTDNWVKGSQFNMDCVQPQWTAENLGRAPISTETSYDLEKEFLRYIGLMEN